MTTTAMHLKLERGRFAQHLKAMLASAVPLAWREALGASARPVLSATEAAAIEVAAEAQRGREMAHAYSKTDPGFAADRLVRYAPTERRCLIAALVAISSAGRWWASCLNSSS